MIRFPVVSIRQRHPHWENTVGQPCDGQGIVRSERTKCTQLRAHKEDNLGRILKECRKRLSIWMMIYEEPLDGGDMLLRNSSWEGRMNYELLLWIGAAAGIRRKPIAFEASLLIRAERLG